MSSLAPAVWVPFSYGVQFTLSAAILASVCADNDVKSKVCVIGDTVTVATFDLV